MPDEVDDVTKDRAYWFSQGYREGARLTPAPLVVRPEMAALIRDAFLPDATVSGVYDALRFFVNHVATRVPAGDDQGDTPEGGE